MIYIIHYHQYPVVYRVIKGYPTAPAALDNVKAFQYIVKYIVIQVTAQCTQCALYSIKIYTGYCIIRITSGPPPLLVNSNILEKNL